MNISTCCIPLDIHCSFVDVAAVPYRTLIHGVHEQIRQNRDEERVRMAQERRKADEHERIVNQPLPPISETMSSISQQTWHSIKHQASAAAGSGDRPNAAFSVATSLAAALPHYDSGNSSTRGAPANQSALRSNSRASGKGRGSSGIGFLPKLSLCSPLSAQDDAMGGGLASTGKKKKARSKKKIKKKKKRRK